MKIKPKFLKAKLDMIVAAPLSLFAISPWTFFTANNKTNISISNILLNTRLLLALYFMMQLLQGDLRVLYSLLIKKSSFMMVQIRGIDIYYGLILQLINNRSYTSRMRWKEGDRFAPKEKDNTTYWEMVCRNSQKWKENNY